MKRMLSVLLVSALLMTSIVLSSCDTQSKEPESPNGAEVNNNAIEESIGDPQTFKFALTVSESHPYSIAAKDFAKIVEEESNGNMKVDLFYDGVLGGDADLLEAMQMNGVTFALMGPAGVQSISPMYNFFDLPGLFASKDAAYDFQESQPVKELLNGLASSGIRGLGFYENGYYAISNSNKPITKISDLSNMKIRSMTSSIAISAWEVLNVQPVSMPFGELFVALQQGVVDGQETTIGSFYSSKFYEVQKELVLSNRIFHIMTFLMSEQAWQELTETQRNILMEAVAKSKEHHKDYMVTFNEDALNDMKENYNLNVTELEPGEFEKMKQMSQPIYDVVRDLEPGTYDKLMEAAKTSNEAYPAN